MPETKGKNEAQLSEYFAKSKLKTTLIKSSAKNLQFRFGKIFAKLCLVFVFGFWDKRGNEFKSYKIYIALEPKYTHDEFAFFRKLYHIFYTGSYVLFLSSCIF